MTENKKPIILVVDDMADEGFVRNNIKNLAEKLGFNADDIAKQVKVFTNAGESLNFIEQSKKDNHPIALAFVDNKMHDHYYGVTLAKAVRGANPNAAVAWISSEPLDETEEHNLKRAGLFNDDDKLMFNSDLSGSLKRSILSDDLSKYIVMDEHPIHDIVIPAMEKAFQQIAPKREVPSPIAQDTNALYGGKEL